MLYDVAVMEIQEYNYKIRKTKTEHAADCSSLDLTVTENSHHV